MDGRFSRCLGLGLLLSLSVLIKTSAQAPADALWGMGADYAAQLSLPLRVAQPATGVAGLAAGGNSFHGLFLKADGALWGMGSNSHGQLGLDAAIDSQPVPVELVPAAVGVVAMATGQRSTLYLTRDGVLWGMGDNLRGQLGDGSTTPRPRPVQVRTGVQGMASGDYHSFLLTSAGALWGMGANESGQLGLGDTDDRHSPVEIRAAGVVAMAAGAQHSYFITQDGALWGMGYNFFGQLGQRGEDTTDRWTPVLILPAGVVAVAAGAHFGLILKADGSLWGVGNASQGQLGIEDPVMVQTQPVRIHAGGVLAMAAGSNHSLFITEGGELWATGHNFLGELGTGDNTSALLPVAVYPGGVVAVAASQQYSLFLTDEGQLHAMGRNQEGQLGDGAMFNHPRPRQLLGSGGRQIAAWHQTLLVKTDGSLWGQGANTFGQLGLNLPSPVTGLHEIMPSGVASVAAGQTHSLVLKTDGTLWAMGANFEGQLGDGTTTMRSTPVQVASGVDLIAAGATHSLFRKTDGSLWSMGSNSEGELGDGTQSNRSTPVQVLPGGVRALAAGDRHTLIAMTDGSLMVCGANFYGKLGTPLGRQVRPLKVVDAGVLAVAAGDHHSLFLTSDGALWGMGNNDRGQLGLVGAGGSTPTQLVNAGVAGVDARGNQTLYRANDGSLWASGANEAGQLGLGHLLDQPTFAQVLPGGVAALAAGYSHTLFLSRAENPRVSVQVGGHGDEPAGPGEFVIIRDGPTSSELTVNFALSGTAVAGADYLAPAPMSVTFPVGDSAVSLAIPVRNDRVVELTETVILRVLPGTGYQPAPAPVAVMLITSDDLPASTVVAAGERHSLWLNPLGGVWLAGDNRQGQLGLAPASDAQRRFPHKLTQAGTLAVAGGAEFSLFANLDSSLWGMGRNDRGQLSSGPLNPAGPALRLPSGVIGVAAGRQHSLLLMQGGQLWGLGANTQGQLGLGHTRDSAVPAPIVARDVLAMAAGAYHSLFIKDDGSLWGMGDNGAGQLGQGATTSFSTPVRIIAGGVAALSAGEVFSLFVKTDGSLWGMGANDQGQLGLGHRNPVLTPTRILSSGVAKVACGTAHALLLMSNGALQSMGDNVAGQLGDGTQTARLSPVVILTAGVAEIAAGGQHSLFVKTDGTRWAMGANAFGQLGIGSTSSASMPTALFLAFPDISFDASTDAAEPATNGAFHLRRSGPSDSPVTVFLDLSTSAVAEVDYQTLPTSLDFARDQVTLNLPLQVLDDAVLEAPEPVTLIVRLDDAYSRGSPFLGTVTIYDNEVPPPSVVQITADNDAAEPATEGRFLLQRSNSAFSTITVNFAVSGSATPGLDYLAMPITQVFGPGDAMAFLRVTVQDDGLVEDDETVIVTLLPGTGYSIGAFASATLRLTSNDLTPPPPAVVTIEPVTPAAEPATPGSVRLARSGSSTFPLGVNIAVSGTATAGSDYQAWPTVIIFPAGQATVTLPVTVLDDSLFEAVETVQVKLLAGPGYTAGKPDSATVNLSSDDQPFLVYTLRAKVSRYGGGAQVAQNSGGFLVLDPASRQAIAIHTSGKLYEVVTWHDPEALGWFLEGTREAVASMGMSFSADDAFTFTGLLARTLSGTRKTVTLAKIKVPATTSYSGTYYQFLNAGPRLTSGTLTARFSSKESAAAIGKTPAQTVGALVAGLAKRKYRAGVLGWQSSTTAAPLAAGVSAPAAVPMVDTLAIYSGTLRDPAAFRGLTGAKPGKDYLILGTPSGQGYMVNTFTMGKDKRYFVREWWAMPAILLLPKGKNLWVFTEMGFVTYSDRLDYALLRQLTGSASKPLSKAKPPPLAPASLKGGTFTAETTPRRIDLLAWSLKLDSKASLAANAAGRNLDAELARLLASLAAKGYLAQPE